MSERKRHYRGLIGLLKVHDLGPRRIRVLLEKTRVRTADDIFSIPVNRLLSIDGIGVSSANNISSFDGWDDVDEIIGMTERAGADLIAFDDPHYPELLRHIFDPPVLLWVLGEKETLSNDGLAVIGTRNPGRYGKEQAEKWSARIVSSGLMVNSGLAYGVDTIAHQTTLNNGGRTVAVLGSGIDVIYPARNKSLVKAIIDKGGAVITEYLPGTKPVAVNFPGRNRIVSGMSHGVIVIESKIKGGSMITARYALDQNREVFVVPHPLGDLSGEGCNYLIKTAQGKLIQSFQDILDEISVPVNGEKRSESKSGSLKKWKGMELNATETKICEILEKGELHIDKLSENMGIQVQELHASLLELELRGALKQRAGKIFHLH
ncbi:MAG: DNA-protecting protein DprA [Balneolaceae bacterium]|nr:MAG: DNA-protecting protein DprA [Balneolaceae bacterium]